MKIFWLTTFITLITETLLATTVFFDPLPPSFLKDDLNLRLVQKMVDVNYYININNANKPWSQYPDMQIEFSLDFPQFVNIEYVIVVHTNKGGWIMTRLIVDGK